MKKLCIAMAILLLLLTLTGCKDNPYKAFDPEGVLVNGYLDEHESVTKLPKDRSFKKSISSLTFYSKRVLMINKQWLFSYVVKNEHVDHADYTFHPDLDEILPVSLKMYEILTSTLGPPKQIMVSKDYDASGKLSAIDETTLKAISQAVSEKSSHLVIVTAQWDVNGIDTRLHISFENSATRSISIVFHE